jgi:hypothetical protein
MVNSRYFDNRNIRILILINGTKKLTILAGIKKISGGLPVLPMTKICETEVNCQRKLYARKSGKKKALKLNLLRYTLLHGHWVAKSLTHVCFVIRGHF